MSTSSPNLHFCIDSPEIGMIPSSCVTVRGWCFTPGGEPIQRIRIFEGSRIHEAQVKLQRPDVKAAYGNLAGSDCGFEANLRLSSHRSVLVVKAEVEPDSWVTLQTLKLQVLHRSTLDSRLGRLLIQVRSLLGSPKAFAALPTADQEFLLNELGQRGLLGLGHLRQYAPRPVILERFPAPRKASKERNPRFCIVTPSFNQGRFLRETAQSVLNQQGTHIDYVIQDGGSKDGSADLIRDLALEFSPDATNRLVHAESRPDKGQSDAIIRGFQHLKGGPDDIMAYLNSDDVYMPRALRFVADYFTRHPKVDVVYGHRVMIDENSDEIGRWVCPRRTFDNLNLMDLIPQETLFWRRRIWDKVGGIDSHFHFAMDWDLLLRFQHAGACIVRLPYFLAMFRVHNEQKTQAWMNDHGVQEMERLRARSLNRSAEPSEISTAMRLAQYDSAIVNSMLRRGYRL
jgi:glycosyltransferase involved in cell wall biosynthesis